ncbi:MAG: head GIN domain-containing protein [Sediminibacterium sp.]
MKPILLFLAAILLLSTSCRWAGYKRVKGNGNIITQDRNISHAERISLKGSYDVEITQGPVTSVKVEGDENLLSLIFVNEEEGYLTIKSKEHVNLVSDNPIRIYITTPKLEQVRLSGSGNIIGKSKFTGGDKLVLKISGSGDMVLETNTPKVDAEISGSGSITLSGETQEQSIRISGVGDYKAEGLKSEKTTVRIAGSGDVRVFADAELDINIAGAGSILYKGNATIKQNITGSGEVKKIE